MSKDVVLGGKIPNVNFGYLDEGQVRSISARKVFEYHRAIVLGVPGAFTPSCTQLYVPDFIRNAARLRASGFSELICIVPNDPFVVKAWADMLDPQRKLTFLSDGNLDFATALGMTSHDRQLFGGKRCERYLMTVEDGVIVRLRSEPEGASATLPTSAIPEVAYI